MRSFRQNPPGDALMFPSQKGTPMRPENWLHRRIKPIAAALGISSPVNFQVLRRTFATNAQGHGNGEGCADPPAAYRHCHNAWNLHAFDRRERVRKLVNAVADDVMSAEKPELRTMTTRLQ